MSVFERYPDEIQFLEPSAKIPTGFITAIVIITAIVAIAIVIILVITSIRNKSAATKAAADAAAATSTSTTQPAVGTIACTSDFQCTGRCDPKLGICVDCIDNTTCLTQEKPLCLVESTRCVACLENTDCNSFSTCSKYQCCDPRAPVVTSVVLDLFETTGAKRPNPSITINYDYYQIPANSRLYVLIKDPATGNSIGPPAKTCATTLPCQFNSDCFDQTGNASLQCLSKICTTPNCISTTVTGKVVIYEQAIGYKFFQNASYNIFLQISYSCGDIKSATTILTSPYTFTTPLFCQGNPSTIAMQSIVDGANDITGYVNQGLNVRFTMFVGDTPTNIYMLIATTPNAHPAACQLVGPIPVLPGENFASPIIGASTYMAVLGRYPPAAGTYYIRMYDAGTNSNCNSQYSNQLFYVYTI